MGCVPHGSGSLVRHTAPWLAAAGCCSDDSGRWCVATAQIAQLAASRCGSRHPHGAQLRGAVGGAPQENHYPVPWLPSACGLRLSSGLRLFPLILSHHLLSL
ncbi:hypothetical protein BS78_09G178400 [Paspalum vaginatum]|nr:hypothetical protein BS78_09G178400 [Paspalum vaginatum]